MNKQKSHEKKKETEPHSKRWPVKELVIPAFQASSNQGPLEGLHQLPQLNWGVTAVPNHSFPESGPSWQRPSQEQNEES